MDNRLLNHQHLTLEEHLYYRSWKISNKSSRHNKMVGCHSSLSSNSSATNNTTKYQMRVDTLVLLCWHCPWGNHIHTQLFHLSKQYIHNQSNYLSNTHITHTNFLSLERIHSFTHETVKQLCLRMWTMSRLKTCNLIEDTGTWIVRISYSLGHNTVRRDHEFPSISTLLRSTLSKLCSPSWHNESGQVCQSSYLQLHLTSRNHSAMNSFS